MPAKCRHCGSERVVHYLISDHNFVSHLGPILPDEVCKACHYKFRDHMFVNCIFVRAQPEQCQICKYDKKLHDIVRNHQFEEAPWWGSFATPFL